MKTLGDCQGMRSGLPRFYPLEPLSLSNRRSNSSSSISPLANLRRRVSSDDSICVSLRAPEGPAARAVDVTTSQTSTIKRISQKSHHPQCMDMWPPSCHRQGICNRSAIGSGPRVEGSTQMSVRFSNWALIATMTVLADMSTAPAAGVSRIPHAARTPAASGIATIL